MSTKSTIKYIGGMEMYHRLAYLATGTSSATADVDTTYSHTGSGSMRCPTKETYFSVNPSFSNGTAIGVSVAFRLDNHDATETATILDPSGLGTIKVQVKGSGGNRYLRLFSADGQEWWLGTYNIAVDTWYVLWFWCYKADATGTIWVAHVRLYDTTGATKHEDSGLRSNKLTSGNLASFTFVYFGMFGDLGSLAGTHAHNYDDIVITEGGPPPVNPQVVGVVPTGDGTDADYALTDGGAPGSTIVHNEVDEVAPTPPDNATFAFTNASSGSELNQTYTHGSVADPASSGNILCLQVVTKLQRTDASGTAVGFGRIRTTSGGSTNSTPFISSAASAAYGRTLFPISVTEVGWATGAGSENSIDDVEFGNSRLTLFKHFKVDNCIMEVAFGANWTDDLVRKGATNTP